MSVPVQPKIYHITHLDNLSGILDEGGLWSYAQRLAGKCQSTLVGMSEIKRRRLKELNVECHPDTKVGEYVPFYFCPRSVMLYILYRGNHPEITYSGGQRPILHLQADLHKTIRWAEKKDVQWAFTKSNAGAIYCDFFASLNQLDEVDWDAVANEDFRDNKVKEGKQAEFLLFDFFPWKLIEKIGVIDKTQKKSVQELVEQQEHQPPVIVESGWYY